MDDITKLKKLLSEMAPVMENCYATVQVLQNGITLRFARNFKAGDKLTIQVNAADKLKQSCDALMDLYTQIWQAVRRAEGKTDEDGIRVIDGKMYAFHVITPADIDAVKPLHLRSLTDDQNEKLTERCRELLRKCSREIPGTEIAMLMTDSLRISCEGKQFDPQTQPHATTYALAGSVHIHNHPSGASFSKQDLITFASCQNLRIMGVVCNTGQTYFMEKTDLYDVAKLQALINYMPNDFELCRRLPYCGINYYYGGELYDD